MHIVVALRLVPDLTGEIEIGEDGRSIDREWIDMKLNEFDDHALEEALQLKEKSGATVTAVALEGEGADRMLQTALARGADKAIKIKCDDDASPSSRAAAPVVAAAARKLDADLIFTGVQTPEDIFGQLAAFVGASLAWPHVSAVSGVSAEADDIVVQQEFSGGITATLRIRLPAVVGIQTASRPIRYVSGTKLRQAAAEKIVTLDVDTPLGPPEAEIVELTPPSKSGGAEMLGEDAKAVAAKIHALLVDRGLMKGEKQ
jgi:electron transfer flavoprotein beta subunit